MKKIIPKYMIMIGTLVLLGCATMTNGYGRLVPDQSALKSLEALQIDPDMNYYFSGPAMRPDAIIGVNKAYTLGQTLWKKIVVTPELVQALVSSIKLHSSEISLDSYAILDDKGKQIGVWYSTVYDFRSYIKMKDERTVDIATPINPIRHDFSPL